MAAVGQPSEGSQYHAWRVNIHSMLPPVRVTYLRIDTLTENIAYPSQITIYTDARSFSINFLAIG